MLHDFSTESVLFHPHIENIQGGGVTVAYFPLTVHPSVFYSSKSHILFIVTLNVHEVVPGYGRAAIKSFSRQPLSLKDVRKRKVTADTGDSFSRGSINILQNRLCGASYEEVQLCYCQSCYYNQYLPTNHSPGFSSIVA